MDVFQLILKELWSSFSWGFFGFLITIFILILLKRNRLISFQSGRQKVKLTIYFIFFPIMIAFGAWIYKAVSSAQEQIEISVTYTVKKVEDVVYLKFHEYITSTIESYSNQIEIPSNDEIVTSFLMEDSTSGWIKRKVLHWSLVELLEYMEKEALEKTGIEVKDHKLTVNALKQDKLLIHIPFKKLEAKVKKPIKSLFTPYFLISYILFGLVFVILVMDIFITYKHKKSNRSLTPMP